MTNIFIHHYLAMLILLQTSPCPSDEDLVPWDDSRPSASLSSPLSPFSVSSKLCPLPPWPDKFVSLLFIPSVSWSCRFSFLSFRSLWWLSIFCFRLSSLSSAMPKGFIALKIKVQKRNSNMVISHYININVIKWMLKHRRCIKIHHTENNRGIYQLLS